MNPPLPPPRRSTILRQRSWRRVQRMIHARRQQRRDPQITHLDMRLPRLPAELAGLRIAHLSDIHYGLYLSDRTLRRILELTMAQRPDLIAITGDFVTQSHVFIEPACEMLAELKAPLGVWAVLGNHDFRAGADRLTAALRRRDIHVLRNQHQMLTHAGMEIRLAGVDDSRQHPDVMALLGRRTAMSGGRGRKSDAGAHPGEGTPPFTLLLAHNPLELRAAAACGVDLVLSGHTHGGQIKPGFAAPLVHRYLPAGFLQQGDTQMYVSRGLGQVILPMRLNAPPELPVLSLHRA